MESIHCNRLRTRERQRLADQDRSRNSCVFISRGQDAQAAGSDSIHHFFCNRLLVSRIVRSWKKNGSADSEIYSSTSRATRELVTTPAGPQKLCLVSWPVLFSFLKTPSRLFDELTKQEVAMTTVRQSTSNQLGPVANERCLAFDIDIAESLTPTLMTDGHHLNQILKNLLSNVFRFTSRGGLTLRINAKAIRSVLNPVRMTM